MAISAEKRKSLPASAFAVPELKKYPLDTKARVRNAAARLEQNKGELSATQYEEAKRRIAAAARKLGIKSRYAEPKSKRRMRLSFSHPEGGRFEVAMSDGGEPTLALFYALEADAAQGDGPVWVQIARVGEFRGHPQGPFSITPADFEDICRNFLEVDRGNVAFDFEHASEMPASEGGIPSEGAPAQGWLRRLENRGQDGLWGLVEWLEPARTYIRQKKYRGLSPAIRFNAKHPETGKPIGARLTSVALTNRPFLRGMAPLAARDDAPGVPMSMGSTCYSSNEYMPRLRMALRMPELCSAEECADKIATLEDLFSAADGDATAMVHGIKLGEYLTPLRELVAAAPHHTWEEVFDAVKALIRAAIEEHEVEEHGGENEDDEGPASMRDPAGDTTMADPNDQTIKLRDLELKNAETTAKLTDATTKLADAQVKLSEATLSLKERDARIAELEGETKQLRDAEEKRLAADREHEVDVAIATYGTKKGITKTDKPDLLALLTAAPASFRKLYPPVEPDKRHLLTDLTGGREAPPPAQPGDAPTISLRDLARKIARERGISIGQAQILAEQTLARGKGA